MVRSTLRATWPSVDNSDSQPSACVVSSFDLSINRSGHSVHTLYKTSGGAPVPENMMSSILETPLGSSYTEAQRNGASKDMHRFTQHVLRPQTPDSPMR